MNDWDRHELEAVRAQLQRLRHEQSLAQQTIERLLTRLRDLESKAERAARQELPKPPPLPTLDRIGQDLRMASSPPPLSAPETKLAEPTPAPREPSSASPSASTSEQTQFPPIGAARGEAQQPPAGGLPPPPILPPPIEEPEPSEPPPQISAEMWIGKYAVPAVGIAMGITALVFTAYYVQAHLPKWGKAVGLYLLCCTGIWIGARLQRKYALLGRWIFAGGLAGVYFVTYALHYVDALHLIDSGLVSGVLLFCIVVVMVGIAQWRNDPWLAGIAILLGFYTSAMSNIATFTLVSNCILAAGALYLMLACGWLPLTGLAFLGTYGTYAWWIFRGAEDTPIQWKIGFVLLYWGLFTLAVFAAREDRVRAVVRNVFATINNLLCFTLITHALLHHHISGQHWKVSALLGAALFGLAWIGKRQFKPDISTFATYLITSLAFLTLAVVEKYAGYQLIAALAIESTLLIVLGHRLRQPAFRWFGAAAQALCVWFIVWNFIDENGSTDRPREIATWFCVAIGYLVALVQQWNVRPEHGPLRDEDGERFLAYALAVFASVALFVTTWQFVHQPFRTTWLAAEALVLFALSYRAQQPFFRWFGIGFQATSVALLVQHLFEKGPNNRPDEIAGWLAVACGYSVTLLQQSHVRPRGESRDNNDDELLAVFTAFLAGAALLLVTCDFIELSWRIPVLAVEAVALLAAGHILKQRTFRWSAGLFQACCVLTMIANYDDRAGDNETTRAIATWTAVLVGYVCSLLQHWYTRAEKGALHADAGERLLATSLAFLANLGLVLANWDFFPERWRATAAAIECAIIASAAGLIGATRLMWTSQTLLLTAYGSLIAGMMEHWTQPGPLHLPFALVAVTLGFAWFGERALAKPQFEDTPWRVLPGAYLCAAVAVVLFSLAQRLSPQWHLWTMLLTALVALGIGQAWRNSSWRWISLSSLAAAIAVWLDHELSQEIPWKESLVVPAHLLAIALLVGFERLWSLGWTTEQAKEARRPIANGLVIIVAYLLVHVLWRWSNREYLTAIWAIGGFVLFGCGLLFRERVYRYAALAVLGLSVARACVYDFWQIQEPLFRILSFAALAGTLIVLGYLYAKLEKIVSAWEGREP